MGFHKNRPKINIRMIILGGDSVAVVPFFFFWCFYRAMDLWHYLTVNDKHVNALTTLIYLCFSRSRPHILLLILVLCSLLLSNIYSSPSSTVNGGTIESNNQEKWSNFRKNDRYYNLNALESVTMSVYPKHGLCQTSSRWHLKHKNMIVWYFSLYIESGFNRHGSTWVGTSKRFRNGWDYIG